MTIWWNSFTVGIQYSFIENKNEYYVGLSRAFPMEGIEKESLIDPSETNRDNWQPNMTSK